MTSPTLLLCKIRRSNQVKLNVRLTLEGPTIAGLRLYRTFNMVTQTFICLGETES